MAKDSPAIEHPLNDPERHAHLTPRSFDVRPEEEQQDFMSMTWCQNCYQADLGMTDPVEYEWQGRVFVEGKCRVCQHPVATEIVEEA